MEEEEEGKAGQWPGGPKNEALLRRAPAGSGDVKACAPGDSRGQCHPFPGSRERSRGQGARSDFPLVAHRACTDIVSDCQVLETEGPFV